jgi:hypothetical protein
MSTEGGIPACASSASSAFRPDLGTAEAGGARRRLSGMNAEKGKFIAEYLLRWKNTGPDCIEENALAIY